MCKPNSEHTFVCCTAQAVAQYSMKRGWQKPFPSG